MATHHLNPDTLYAPSNNAYTHVVTVDAGRLAYISGQVAYDAQGNLVGGDDVAAQARQCFLNLRSALEAVGATTSDLVKITTYVVGYDSSMRPGIGAARNEILAADPPPASTLLGVASLAFESLLVEVDAVAVIP